MCTLPHSWNICTHQFDPSLVICTKNEISVRLFLAQVLCKTTFFFFLFLSTFRFFCWHSIHSTWLFTGPVNPLFKHEILYVIFILSQKSFCCLWRVIFPPTSFFQPSLPYSVHPSIHSSILSSFHPCSTSVLCNSFSSPSLRFPHGWGVLAQNILHMWDCLTWKSLKRCERTPAELPLVHYSSSCQSVLDAGLEEWLTVY